VARILNEMRILLLTQWFDPEPAFKGLAFARELSARGHEVEVLTGYPNYPGGALYPGYRIHSFDREMMDGVRVVRVPLYPSHDRSRVGRAVNYLSFAASASAFGRILTRAPDVIYAYHPPATIGLPAAVIGRLCRAPVVLDVQDLWPDTLTATGMVNGRRALWLVGRLCSWNYRRAARIVVLSPGFRRALEGRLVPTGKLRVIYNWCDERGAASASPAAALASRFGFEGRFNIVFAGTMGFAQALDAVLGAAERCRERRPDIQFVFVGGGVDKDRLERLAVEKRLPNVRFLPRQSSSEIGTTLALADGLLVHLRDHPLFRITIPSKTQAYLFAGRPIIMAVRGDAADLVKAAGAGVLANPEDPESIADAALSLAAMPAAQHEALGRNGAEYYRRHLSIREGVSRFEEVFEEVVANSRRGVA
jgi:glycosyltransferase involved in cell wall biosynthesis